MILCFSGFSGLTDNKPKPRVAEWGLFVNMLSRHLPRPARPSDGKQAAGGLWSPTIYRDGALRGSDGVESVTAFVADVDDGSKPDFESWDALGLCYLAHSSFRHTTESPRWRVIFPLVRPVPAQEWPRVWRKLAEALIGGHTDPLCKNCDRFYFLPAAPKERLDIAWVELGPGQTWLDPDEFEDLPEERKPLPSAEESKSVQRGADDRGRLLDTLVSRYIGRAAPGRRNAEAFDLACQLRDNEFSGMEALGALERYKAAMGSDFDDDMGRVWESACRKTGREPWTSAKSIKPLATRRTGERSSEERRQLQSSERGGVASSEDVRRAEALGALDGWSVLEDRPAVVCAARQDRDIIEDAWVALGLANDQHPLIYARGRSLVLLAQDASGNPYTQTLTADLMSYALRRAADWVKIGRKGDLDPARFPKWVAEDMLSDPGGAAVVPTLRGVVAAPVVTPSGELLVEQGYDKTSGLYMAPYPELAGCDPEYFDLVEESQWLALARESVGALFRAFEEFPYATRGDRANALALLLTPFLRHYIRGPVPLFVVEAPTPGTGKTLLASSLLAIACPGRIITDGPSERERGASEEWSKHLGALLSSSPSAVLLDNLRGMIASGTLEGILTSPSSVSVRILGKSEMQQIDVSGLTMAATGNNALFQHDMARRSCFVRLDAGIERPEERGGFGVSELGQWVTAHRGELLGHVAKILGAWIALGRPDGSAKKGSFERWAAVLSGVLEVCGVDGFLESDRVRAADSDTETMAWRAFFNAWWDKHASSPVATRSLVWELHEREDGYGEKHSFKRPGLAIEHEIVADDPRAPRALAARLKAYKDRVYAGFKLTQTTDRKGFAMYALAPVQVDRGADSADSADSDFKSFEKTVQSGNGQEAKNADFVPTLPTLPTLFPAPRAEKTPLLNNHIEELQTESAESAESAGSQNPSEGDAELDDPFAGGETTAPPTPVPMSELVRNAHTAVYHPEGRADAELPELASRWRELAATGETLRSTLGAGWKESEAGLPVWSEIQRLARRWAAHVATVQRLRDLAAAGVPVAGETVRAGVSRGGGRRA